MDLYFSPLAGSLAARIALYEAGADARFIEVDPETKRTSDGSDFAEIYPLGLVPLLRLDDGSLLSENAATLQYIANRFPLSNLAPTDFGAIEGDRAAHCTRGPPVQPCNRRIATIFPLIHSGRRITHGRPGD